jgi:hypothetical protein
MRRLQAKVSASLKCHGLVVNIKRVRRRTINPRVESKQNYNNPPFMSTGSHLFSGPRFESAVTMLVDLGDHTILCNTQNGLTQLPSCARLTIGRLIDRDADDKWQVKTEGLRFETHKRTRILHFRPSYGELSESLEVTALLESTYTLRRRADVTVLRCSESSGCEECIEKK